MSIHSTTKNRKRRVIFGVVATCLSASVIGGSYAAITAQIDQTGNSITYEATLTPAFVDGSGLINANLTPGESAQPFTITVKNDGTLLGQPTYWVHGISIDDYSDAALDDTIVVVRNGETDLGGQISLRTFLTSAFVKTDAGSFIKNGEETTFHFTFIPPSDLSNWTEEDLGLLDQEFPSTLHLTLASSTTSDLAEYAKANGEEVYGGIYAIPVGDVATGAAGSLTGETNG